MVNIRNTVTQLRSAKMEFTYSPPEEPYCYTMYYYQSPGALNVLSGFGCYIEDTTLNIYEKTTAAGAVMTMPPIGTSTTASYSNSDTFQTTSGSQQTASSGQPASHNNGWIAGVVIGAIAGLAIIIGVGFWIWYLHRRLAQNQTEKLPTQQTQPPLPKDQFVQPLQPASPAQMHELPAVGAAEIPAGNPVPELHG